MIIAPEGLVKLGNPRNFAKFFGTKSPQVFCANEDCVYKKFNKCPAGELKKSCPNKSSLDYTNGCPFYVGKPYQFNAINNSLMGVRPITIIITGRGTGKSSTICTNIALEEAIIMPYIRAFMSKSRKPIPTKIILVGNTKDTAINLRNAVHMPLDNNELAHYFVDPNNDTKTYTRFTTGSELFIRTVGSDGKSIRGFHPDTIKNEFGEYVKGTIVFIFDEACFSRCRTVVNEVMRPSLQAGNEYSGIRICSTPWWDSGEINDLYDNPGNLVDKYNFASYHNRFTNLQILLDFRRRLEAAGAPGIYNREVLGIAESDNELFFPYEVWEKGIDDDLDWMEYEDILNLHKKGEFVIGRFYMGIDPNKFKQKVNGDNAAIYIVSVSADRQVIRGVFRGKYLLDLEDQFVERIQVLNSVFRPKRIICCANSGYIGVFKGKGLPILTGSNEPLTKFRAMSMMKIDIVNGIIRNPSCSLFENERSSYVLKDPEETGSTIRLDHEGEWGEGFSSDLMDCCSFIYEQMMKDYGISDNYIDTVASIDINKFTKQSPIVISQERFSRIKR